MEMIKAICVHLMIGFILTQLLNNFIVPVGPVVVGGGSDNLTIGNAMF